jgi:hypothetical protein
VSGSRDSAGANQRADRAPATAPPLVVHARVSARRCRWDGWVIILTRHFLKEYICDLRRTRWIVCPLFHSPRHKSIRPQQVCKESLKHHQLNTHISDFAFQQSLRFQPTISTCLPRRTHHHVLPPPHQHAYSAARSFPITAISPSHPTRHQAIPQHHHLVRR